jgi:hypothetical protein
LVDEWFRRSLHAPPRESCRYPRGFIDLTADNFARRLKTLQRLVGRGEIEPDDLGRLGGEGGILARAT